MATPADTPYGTIAVPIQENEPGHDVPPGGTTGQVLSKASGTDYDTAWEPVATRVPLFATFHADAVTANFGAADPGVWIKNAGSAEITVIAGDIILPSGLWLIVCTFFNDYSTDQPTTAEFFLNDPSDVQIDTAWCDLDAGTSNSVGNAGVSLAGEADAGSKVHLIWNCPLTAPTVGVGHATARVIRVGDKT